MANATAGLCLSPQPGRFACRASATRAFCGTPMQPATISGSCGRSKGDGAKCRANPGRHSANWYRRGAGRQAHPTWCQRPTGHGSGKPSGRSRYRGRPWKSTRAPAAEHAQCLGIVANVFWAPGAGSSRRTRSVTNPIRHSSGRGRPNRLTIPRPAFLPRPRAPRSFRVGQPAIVRSPSCPGVFRHPRARAFPVQNRPLDPCCSQRFPHDHQQRG
jgi:hypothetical protein